MTNETLYIDRIANSLERIANALENANRLACDTAFCTPDTSICICGQCIDNFDNTLSDDWADDNDE